MSVSLVTGSGASTISQILNLSTESATATSSATAASSGDGDAVTISASGSAASGLLALMRQRASLVEARSKLASSSAEDGESTDVQTQLESYDSQISELDAQIAEAKAAAAGEQASSVLTYSGNTYAKTGSTAASSSDALNAVAGLSASLSTARAAASSMNRLDRQAESLQAEIDADKSRGADTADKESELETLQEKLSGASSTLSAGLDGINQQFL
jgi:chromosome segregation ATPase